MGLMGRIPAGELLRKGVHIGSVAAALFLRYLEPWQAMAIAVLALAFNAVALPRLTGRRLERQEELRRGYAPGILLYPLSVLLLLVLFPHRLEIVAAAWGIMALGDGMGTVAGKWVGGSRLPWNPNKTITGTVAFFLFGTVGSLLLFQFVRGGTSGTPMPWGSALILCGTVTAICAVVEGMPLGIDDNLIVPLLAGGLLFAFTLVDPALLRGGNFRFLTNFLVGLALNGLLALVFLKQGWVDRSGSVAGLAIGILVFTFGGWQGFALLLLFFSLGTGATRLGFRRKASRGIAQERGGARSARHAVANTGLAAFLFFLAASTPHRQLLLLAAVAALATAAFDTVSSEIGQLSSRGTILVTTLRRVPPGTDGAVSPLGTAAGLLAAGILSTAALGLSLLGSPAGILLVIAAAFVGGTVESFIGATLEKRRWMDNEAVNFLNTLIGSGVAIGGFRWLA